jgi:hypothetical protein
MLPNFGIVVGPNVGYLDAHNLGARLRE